MRFWLSYKFRGADLNQLRAQIEELVEMFKSRGHEVVTMFRDIQNWDADCMPKDEAVRREYELAKFCDATLSIYSGTEPSEGRGWDVGFFAGMGKPTIMAIRKDVSIPFTEALFSENPANKISGLPSIIRYEKFEDIVLAIPTKE